MFGRMFMEFLKCVTEVDRCFEIVDGHALWCSMVVWMVFKWFSMCFVDLLMASRWLSMICS